MLARVREDAARAAQTAALTGLGAILAAVGLGFLTVAAWIALAAAKGAVFAALILGGCYAGAGLLIAGLALARHGRQAGTGDAAADLRYAHMTAAFLSGFRAAQAPPRDGV